MTLHENQSLHSQNNLGKIWWKLQTMQYEDKVYKNIKLLRTFWVKQTNIDVDAKQTWDKLDHS